MFFTADETEFNEVDEKLVIDLSLLDSEGTTTSNSDSSEVEIDRDCGSFPVTPRLLGSALTKFDTWIRYALSQDT